VILRSDESHIFASSYFTEEVRRQLIAHYGANALYQEGLSVRTTLHPHLQAIAQSALHNGLVQFDQNHGWRGAYEHIDNILGDWGESLSRVKVFLDIPAWKIAVVLKNTKNGVKIGLKPRNELSGTVSKERETGFITIQDMKWALHMVDEQGRHSTATNPAQVLQVGDVILVEAKKNKKNSYHLRQIPKVQGAMVIMDPVTGRVLAMIGGFSYLQSEFNRATQAYRQPGSAFKPFVYAAALDNGYTPASVVLDGPLEIDQGSRGIWQPRNYSNTFAGPATLRNGIEYSRNLMTVRLANDLGMPIVAEYAERFGIYDKMQPMLSMSLGAGETTVLRLVTAYAVIANGGRSIQSSMIDRIQNRYGHTIYRHDQRRCAGCNVEQWNNQPEPELIDERDQVLDPMTAYQITSMMEGVVQRGTARRLRDLNRTIAGKTGTTNDFKDAWFIGFTPDMVVGVFVGYDIPKSLGTDGTGSALAAPIFGEFMRHAMKGKPNVDFKMPESMMKIAIDRRTGMHAEASKDNIIIEAFKPGTGPADIYQIIGSTESFREGIQVPLVSPQVSRAIESGAGGLY